MAIPSKWCLGMLRIVAASLLALALGACERDDVTTTVKHVETSRTVAQRAMLVGRWLGQADAPGGGTKMWIADRRRDGTYQIDFRLIDAARNESSHSEVGIWGVSGGIYFTATRGFIDADGAHPANTTNPALYDTYWIVELDDRAFAYESLSTGSRHKARKLSSGEGFPPG